MSLSAMRPRLPTMDSFDYEEYDGEGEMTDFRFVYRWLTYFDGFDSFRSPSEGQGYVKGWYSTGCPGV